MVAELVEALPISQPAVSQHLRVLQDARLVQAEPDGSRRIYRLSPAGLEEVRSFISRMWDDALDAYEKQAIFEESERKGD
jgi:DNA-binding transcriptional ArsR family regulator